VGAQSPNGDLVATCMSPQSRKRHVSAQLGLGRSLEEVLGEMRMVAAPAVAHQLRGSLPELLRHESTIPWPWACHETGDGSGTAARAGAHSSSLINRGCGDGADDDMPSNLRRPNGTHQSPTADLCNSS
jgi:hypothetical protein